MVEVGTGGKGTKYIKRKYPVTEGLTAGTTKQEGKQMNMLPTRKNCNRKEFEKGL